MVLIGIAEHYFAKESSRSAIIFLITRKHDWKQSVVQIFMYLPSEVRKYFSGSWLWSTIADSMMPCLSTMIVASQPLLFLLEHLYRRVPWRSSQCFAKLWPWYMRSIAPRSRVMNFAEMTLFYKKLHCFFCILWFVWLLQIERFEWLAQSIQRSSRKR